ncbi:hypothetical protein [Streptomyces sp. NPDC060194]|uniref:hypothetical protein n=1 Tax=Streptomyces sp. NPDC060194 TaxID=3347069 RepID=UPI0036522020
MGWTVLYIAFGIVALWLLAEVLLQYKARLRWRLLAFVGFLVVVFGVALSSRVVIALGAITFAVGQTYVTMAFRRGFSTGWALGGNPGISKRRKGEAAALKEPTLEVSDLSYDPADVPGHALDAPDAVAATAPLAEPVTSSTSVFPVHDAQPSPDGTGQWSLYDQSGFATPQTAQDPGDTGGHSYPFPGQTPQQDPYAATGYDTGGYPTYGTGTYDTGGYDTGAYPYGYNTDTGQSYAAYSDPYIGAQSYPQPGYDTYGGGYGQGYGSDTPPGGVWVPQQRDGEQAAPPGAYDDGQQGGALPPEQPYPYQDEQANRY